MVGPNPIWIVSLKEEQIRTQTHHGKDKGRRRPSVSEGERPQKKSILLTPWPRTSSLQNHEKNICCLSHPVGGALLQQPKQTDANPIFLQQLSEKWQEVTQKEKHVMEGGSFECLHYPTQTPTTVAHAGFLRIPLVFDPHEHFVSGAEIRLRSFEPHLEVRECAYQS